MQVSKFKKKKHLATPSLASHLGLLVLTGCQSPRSWTANWIWNEGTSLKCRFLPSDYQSAFLPDTPGNSDKVAPLPLLWRVLRHCRARNPVSSRGSAWGGPDWHSSWPLFFSTSLTAPESTLAQWVGSNPASTLLVRSCNKLKAH